MAVTIVPRIARLLLAVGIVALCVALAAAPAHAHTSLSASCPGANEVVSELEAIELTFASPIVSTPEQPPTIALATGDGRTDLDLGPTGQVEVNKLRADVRAAPAEPGLYIVRYQVLSFDGDLNDGGFQFTFDPDASDATNCRPATTDDGGGSGAGGWILLGGGAVALLVVAYLLRPRAEVEAS